MVFKSEDEVMCSGRCRVHPVGARMFEEAIFQVVVVPGRLDPHPQAGVFINELPWEAGLNLQAYRGLNVGPVDKHFVEV